MLARLEIKDMLAPAYFATKTTNLTCMISSSLIAITAHKSLPEFHPKLKQKNNITINANLYTRTASNESDLSDASHSILLFHESSKARNICHFPNKQMKSLMRLQGIQFYAWLPQRSAQHQTKEYDLTLYASPILDTLKTTWLSLYLKTTMLPLQKSSTRILLSPWALLGSVAAGVSHLNK